jgi:hypothetical protein
MMGGLTAAAGRNAKNTLCSCPDWDRSTCPKESRGIQRTQPCNEAFMRLAVARRKFKQGRGEFRENRLSQAEQTLVFMTASD